MSHSQQLQAPSSFTKHLTTHLVTDIKHRSCYHGVTKICVNIKLVAQRQMTIKNKENLLVDFIKIRVQVCA